MSCPDTIDTIPGTPSSIPGQFDLGTPKDGFPPAGVNSRSYAYIAPRTSLVKSILAPLLSLLPRIGGRSKRNDEGIIAPRTPLRGSPMPSPGIQPQGYSPWGAPDGPGGANNLTPGGASVGGLSPSSSFSNSVANRAMLSPLKINAPPPRRTASEINVSGATGSSVAPRRMGTPSNAHDASSSPYGNGMTTAYMSEEPGSMGPGSRSVSPAPMMANGSPSAAGLTARRAGRKDD